MSPRRDMWFFLRRRVSWIVAGLLIFPFILFFHATGRGPVEGPGGNAGVIFGHAIPWDVFQEQRQRLVRQLEQQFGGEIPKGFDAFVTQSAWDRLILREEAKRRRLRIEDRELAAFIQRIPAFQDKGQFVSDRYHRYLQMSGTTAQAFEESIRHDMLVERLVNAIKNTVTVTDEDVKAAYLEAHEARQALLILFDPSTFVKEAERSVTDAEVRTRYESHPDEVRIPEQLTIEYAGVARDELAEPIQPSDQDVKDFYDDHPDRFAKEDGSATPFEEAKSDARRQCINERARRQLTALALDLEDDVSAKRSFDEIVKTRALGRRQLGPVAADGLGIPGLTDPQMLKSVRELAVGEMSGVLESDAGVYLARMLTRTPPRVPPFEDVRTPARQRLVQERARDAAKSAAQALHARLKERTAAGWRFEEAALTESRLPAREVRVMRAQPIDPIGYAPAVNEAAFATQLGQFTDVIETPRGFAILRPEERILADESQLSQTKETLRQEVLLKKQSARIEEWLQDLRSRAKLKSFVDTAPSEP